MDTEAINNVTVIPVEAMAAHRRTATTVATRAMTIEVVRIRVRKLTRGREEEEEIVIGEATILGMAGIDFGSYPR